MAILDKSVMSYELGICSIDKTAVPGNSDFAHVSNFGKGVGDGRGSTYGAGGVSEGNDKLVYIQ